MPIAFVACLPRYAPLLLSLGGGALLALGGEPWALWPAPFAALVCLVAALTRTGRGPSPVIRGALVGLFFGATVNAVALGSLVDLLADFARFPAPLAWLTSALAWAAQAMPYAAGCALCELVCRRHVPLWFAFPPALTLALSFTPQLFPWRPGATQVHLLPLAQIADLGGEPLLDLCLTTVASGLYTALERRGRARLRVLGIAVACLLVPCLYGLPRQWQIEKMRAAAPLLRLGVVQSNVGIHLKQKPARSGEILRQLRRMTAALEAQGAALTVWAETAYPYPLSRESRTQPKNAARIVGGNVRGPVVIGAVTYATTGVEERKYNSAWLVRPDGSLGDRVDKSRLLAFGEFVPFWEDLPALRRRFPSRGFTAGDNDVIRTHGTALGMLICYEDLFFGLARKVVERGAEVLVNLTNDGWFGRSHEPALHDMIARVRAIETRRDLVRAVNTGVSSFSAATGEPRVRTQGFEPASFVAEVRLLRDVSPYVALGDWVSPVCGLSLLGAAFRYRRAC